MYNNLDYYKHKEDKVEKLTGPMCKWKDHDENDWKDTYDECSEKNGHKKCDWKHHDKYDWENDHKKCDSKYQDKYVTNGSQTHTHEFLGSTKLASEEEGEEVHNHRFAGVSSEVILVPGGHVHQILVNTDFFDHLHEVGVRTGLQIPVGNGKHVHFAEGNTTFNDGHCHKFQFATLIEAPLLPEEDCP